MLVDVFMDFTYKDGLGTVLAPGRMKLVPPNAGTSKCSLNMSHYQNNSSAVTTGRTA